MALSGDLKDFSLLQLLTLVQITEKSGALTMQRSKEKAVVYFENGRLTKVLPPETRAEGLATALYRAGKIDKEQYELISSQKLPSEKAIGLLFIDQGAITQDEIVEFVRDRSLAQLLLLLTWADGSFRFDVDLVPSDGDILAPTDLAPVLDRGRAYLEEWRVLVSQIPDLDRPVRLSPEPQRPIQEVCLSLAEWKMVAAIPGSSTLRDVAQKLELDEFAVRKVAYGLISAGLMDIVPDEPAVPEQGDSAMAEAIKGFQDAIQLREPEPSSTPPQTAEEPDQPKTGALSRFFGRK